MSPILRFDGFQYFFAALIPVALCGLSTSAFAMKAPIDLGALGGGMQSSYATGANATDSVVGYAQSADLGIHAFLYDSTNGFQDLGTLPGGGACRARDINDKGVIVGDALNQNGYDHAFTWTKTNGFKDIGTLSSASLTSIGTGINVKSHVCGYGQATARGPMHAFFYTSTAGFTDLGVPAGYVASFATGVNDNDQVCGYVIDGSGNTNTFVWAATTGVVLHGAPPGDHGGEFLAINNGGDAVGFAFDSQGRMQPIKWNKQGGNQQFPLPAGATNGIAVNIRADNLLCDSDVGVYTVQQATHKPILVPAGPPGASSVEPVALDGSGEVAGWADFATGSSEYAHAFIATSDIGALPGGSDSKGLAVNANGVVVGESLTNGAHTDAVYWDSAHAVHDLGQLASGAVGDGAATAINASDQIAGYSVADGSGDRHAFLYGSGSGLQDLGTLPAGTESFGMAVNSSGMVAGSADTAPGGPIHAVISAAGGLQDLGALPGGASSYANGIDDAGQVVGVADNSSGLFAAFLWDSADGMQSLGFLPGGIDSTATAINASGLAVGYGSISTGAERGFKWTADGGLVNLGKLGAGFYSRALAVNAGGTIVGIADNKLHQPRAVIWKPGKAAQDLNTLVSSSNGLTLQAALGISDAGDITGYAVNASGQVHGFLIPH